MPTDAQSAVEVEPPAKRPKVPAQSGDTLTHEVMPATHEVMLPRPKNILSFDTTSIKPKNILSFDTTSIKP